MFFLLCSSNPAITVEFSAHYNLKITSVKNKKKTIANTVSLIKILISLRHPSRLKAGSIFVRPKSWCPIAGAQLSWCLSVLVPPCPGAQLSWCPFVLVLNCPVPNCLGAQLSGAHLSVNRFTFSYRIAISNRYIISLFCLKVFLVYLID